MIKRGQLSRADLLAVLTAETALQQVLADALGIQQVQAEPEAGMHGFPVEHEPEQVFFSGSAGQQPVAANHLQNASPTALLRSRYWQLLEQKNREDEQGEDTEEVITQRPVWRNKPLRPAFPALMSASVIQQRLLPAIRQQQTTRRIDLERLTEQMGRAEFITELPLLQQQRDTQALQIIDDRQVHLMPYWLDHSWLTWHLMGAMAEYRLSRAVIEQGEVRPHSILHNELGDYQSPPEGSTLLLLSDLGMLSGRLAAYRVLLHQWLRQGYHLVVVTPCHVADYPAELTARMTFVSWEANCRQLPDKLADDEDSMCPRQQWAEDLLILCSVTVRLEPELLRAIRYALNRHLLAEGKAPLPAAAESLAWQHRAVTQRHSVAATVDAKQNKDWQSVLREKPFELRKPVFAVMRSWRVTLADEIWFEEFLSVERCCAEQEQQQLDWFGGDAADVAAFFRYMDQQVLSGAGIPVDQLAQNRAWMQRVAGRMNGAVVNDGQFSHVIQRCLYRARGVNEQIPGGHVLDPQIAGQVDSSKPLSALKSVWLCQLGNQLVVTRHDPFEIPRQRSSLIARLDYRELQLNVIQPGITQKVALPEQLDDGFIPLAGTEDLLPQALRLQTDLTELRLAGFQRPAWAKRVGRDAYGLFAELAIPNDEHRELVQCFRWIPAGAFMMGSPKSEPERWDDEDYHQVTLSQGYWLADTAVTQEVWEAVMGENPAQFADDPRNPVEQVSWNDCQDFIERLHSLRERHGLAAEARGGVLRLPTEAEWEYACRAGTTTPFSLGGGVTSEQVNFRGTEPYNNGKKSEFREKTVAVKSLSPNQWGLYEMHGNVWEWCMDVWQEHSGTQAMLDPCHSSVEKAASRVIRGGSWVGSGRYVRSACRSLSSPGNRSGDLGFRLSLGHEFQARSAELR